MLSPTGTRALDPYQTAVTDTWSPWLYYDTIPALNAISDDLIKFEARRQNRERSLNVIFALNVNQKARHAQQFKDVWRFKQGKFCKKYFGRMRQKELIQQTHKNKKEAS